MNKGPPEINLLGLSPLQLTAYLQDRGEPAFRAKQVYRQAFVNLTTDFREMTDLPQGLRRRLVDELRIGDLDLITVQAGDQGMTRKALFRLPKGETIEAVLMVYPDRATVCVSSQAGCPMGCVFCATAKLGFLRDLSTAQIVEQVLWAARTVREMASQGEAETDRLTNIVFMGMGEAFNNYDAWWAAVERLHDPAGFNLGARNFTVSTVGLVPGIRRLSQESLPINLAISLHAAADALRSALMPVNKAFPVAVLLEATRDYVRQTGRRVSFEVVLLEAANDEPRHAEQMAELLAHGPMSDCRTLMHVNLIPWNPVPGTPLGRSCRERVLAFQQILKAKAIPCTVRVERGADIAAACGQLAGTTSTGPQGNESAQGMKSDRSR